MVIRIILTLMLLGISASHVSAQGRSDELDKLDDKFTNYFERVLPGWRHKRGEPIVNTSNILIELWYSPNRSVKVAVVPHKSAREARDGLQQLISHEPRNERLAGYGEEAYAWGYGLADVVFRRGRYLVYVSTYAEVDNDPEAQSLTQNQKFDREKIEKRRLSLEFAKHAVGAIDAP